MDRKNRISANSTQYWRCCRCRQSGVDAASPAALGGCRFASTASCHRNRCTPEDLGARIKALNDHGVEYAVIGESAMMFHVFPSATRHIDLLLPLSRSSNRKLRTALMELAFNQEALQGLNSG
jgi:hypothetical protein